MNRQQKKWHHSGTNNQDWRLEGFRYLMIAFVAIIVLKLFVIQVIEHGTYNALAQGQHEIFQKLIPKRGTIFVHDDKDLKLVPVASNHQVGFVYADPRHITDPILTVASLTKIFNFDPDTIAKLEQRFSNKEDPYEPIKHFVPQETLNELKVLKIPGIEFVDEIARIYPEGSMSGHVLGFVGSDKDGKQSGKYGIEGYFDKILAGEEGYLKSDHDIAGRLITTGDMTIQSAKDGSDIVLTLDRTIQFQACSLLNTAVKKHGADSGSIVIVDPKTGRILAMCGAPDFDPNKFNEVKDINSFNNQAIFNAYEPGSVFKAITMAAALDVGAVTPSTVFTDTGTVMVDGWPKPLGNASAKVYGVSDMTKVLEESINTGMVFSMRQMGVDVFTSYVKKFGFGKKTNIELDKESSGNISQLDKSAEVYKATASFGHGITVTPLQIVMAYAAIANGGMLKKPYIVDEIRNSNGTVEKRSLQDITQVISQKTSRTLGAMLVSVVERGHGKKAGVPGYYIGGKTGTAQVTVNGVYVDSNTIGSFAGFAPVEDPKFAMVVRIDHPRDVVWAESTAAPLFGEMSKFLLQYYEVVPVRK